MKLSVVIPTHNRFHSLFKLLESIQRQSFSLEDFEVLIVTNSLNDSVHQFDFNTFQKNIKVLCSEAQGVNCARNYGLKRALGDVVLFLDDDCILDCKDFLKRVTSFHTQYPEATAIGGVYDIESSARAIDKAYYVIGRSWQAPKYYGQLESTALVGGNTSYKRKKLMAKNLFFDENIVFGGTESEFHDRLEAALCQLLLIESLKVIHRTELNLEKLRFKAKRQASSHKLYNLKNHLTEYNFKSYHNTQMIVALKVAKNKEELSTILNNVAIYNEAYLETLNENLALKKRSSHFFKGNLSRVVEKNERN